MTSEGKDDKVYLHHKSQREASAPIDPLHPILIRQSKG